MKSIKREQYLKDLSAWKDKDVIKVVTGIRRCGKSTLFEQFQAELRNSGVPDKNIISLNLENPENSFETYKEFYQAVVARLDRTGKNYVFLDEVQNVPDFEKAVDGLYILPNVDLYITGSNAYLLSGELATLLSGRYVEIKLLPFSFTEFLSATSSDSRTITSGEPSSVNPVTSDHDRFLSYLKYGGLPGVVTLLTNEQLDIEKYYDGILSTVVYKDIMTRSGFKDRLLLESILKFIFDSIGSPISPTKIANTLTSKGVSVSNHTVENYLSSFLECFLLYKAERYDIKGKSLLARDYKLYTVDTGLRNYLLGKRAGADMGHLLENVVYLELLRRGYTVNIGKTGEHEIDFIARTSSETRYYQVALSVRDDAVLERELRSLRKTGDFYPRTLLTLDPDLPADYDGVEKQNVVSWLKGE